jgi:hypothetical protein
MNEECLAASVQNDNNKVAEYGVGIAMERGGGPNT